MAAEWLSGDSQTQTAAAAPVASNGLQVHIVLYSVEQLEAQLVLLRRVQAKLSEDGSTIELEVESEVKEDGREEKRKVEYTVAK